MASQPAFSSYRPWSPADAERAPARQQQPQRHYKVGITLVGLLLASGAATYVYRQYVDPTYNADNTALDATVVPLPEPSFDPIGPGAAYSEPAGAALAVLTSDLAPQEQEAVAAQAGLPRSPDGAPYVGRGRVTMVAPVVAPAPRPRQPAAEIAGPLPSRPLPTTDSALAEAAAPDVGELPQQASAAPASTIEDVAETTSLIPATGTEAPAEESVALSEPVTNADAELSGIPSDEVQPLAETIEAQALPQEAVASEGAQLASAAPLAVPDDIAGTPEDVAPELPATPDAEPPAALAAASEDRLSQPSPVSANPSPGGERIAGPAVAGDGLVPPQPVRPPLASAVAPEPASPSTEYVQHFPMVVANGTPLGAITVREFGGNDRRVHLGALLSLFRAKMDPAEYERLISAGSADRFVSIEELRRSGLNIRYDAGRERVVIEPSPQR